jgi:hypothetical protein
MNNHILVIGIRIMGKGTDNGEIRMDGKGDGYSRIYIYVNICIYFLIC